MTEGAGSWQRSLNRALSYVVLFLVGVIVGIVGTPALNAGPKAITLRRPDPPGSSLVSDPGGYRAGAQSPAVVEDGNATGYAGAETKPSVKVTPVASPTAAATPKPTPAPTPKLTPRATRPPPKPTTAPKVVWDANPYSFAGSSDDPFWETYEPAANVGNFWERQVTHGLAPAWHVEQHRSLTYRHASKDAVDVDPEAYALSREFMETFAEDNFIMVTWANYHYLDFVLNWVEHVEASGVQAYVVGAMDNELLQELVGRGIHTFSMDSGLE